MIEAVDPFKIDLISILTIYEVFNILHMLWMCIRICPYQVPVAVVLAQIQNLPMNWGLLQGDKQWSSAMIEDRPIQDGSHINVKHI